MLRNRMSLTLAAVAVYLAASMLPVRAQAPAKPAPKPAPKSAAAPAPAQPTPGSGPVIVIETAKGTTEFETYPDDAPKTVAHVVNLAKRGFYNGMRFHRVVPGFIVQVGDP